MELSRSSASRCSVAFASVLVCVSSLAADFEFNRLNSCSDVAQVLRATLRPASGCGAATGAIERAIRDGAAGSSASPCFLEQPPVNSLSGFRCVHVSSGRGAGNITCYRTATLSVIEECKKNDMDKYAAATSAYMEAAKVCSGSNGQSSPTADTTFPPTLMPVSAHEFGFNVQYGNSRPGTAIITHGFARTSPEIANRGPAAIEYVSFTNGAQSTLRPRMAVGNWRLQVDTSPESFDPFLKLLKKQGLDAYLASVDIDMRRAPLAPQLSKSSSLPRELSDNVVSALQDEDFEEMDNDDFEFRTGKSKAQATEEFSKNVFFGARMLWNGAAPSFRLLIKDSGIPCTNSNRGAVGAYIFMLEGNPNTKVDFGSISTVLIGLGACASSSGSSRAYIQNLASDIKQQLLDELGAR